MVSVLTAVISKRICYIFKPEFYRSQKNMSNM